MAEQQQQSFGTTLRQMVRDTRDRTGLIDPGELAEAVIRQLKRTQYRAALQCAMRDYVRHVLTEGRPLLGLVRSRPSSTAGRATQSRQTWAAILDSPVLGAGHKWRPLRECTVADLRAAIDYNEKQAALNTARAKQYGRIVDLLDRHGCEKVGDLPPDALGDALGDAA